MWNITLHGKLVFSFVWKKEQTPQYFNKYIALINKDIDNNIGNMAVHHHNTQMLP
jgi:hypothetical protein